jgi:histidinol-phosphatase (PHP family)
MEDMCTAALAGGLTEIAFTEHLEVHPKDNCPGHYKPAAYFAELERCRELFRGRLTIRAGIEVGDSHRFPADIAAVTRAWPYDFALGSVHWVGDDAPFGPAFFRDHARDWAWTHYLEEMRAKAEADDFDVIAHLDLLKREGTAYYGAFDAAEYADTIRAILKRLVERGKGIEINTSGWRRPANESCPGPMILEWYAELGGEILTIGSDSHRVAHVGLFWDDAVAVARRAGLRWLTTYESHQPTQHSLAG